MVTERKGQAMIELAIGMFLIVLVVSMLIAFVFYIQKSLQMQNSVRVGASSQHDTVEVTESVFGTDKLNVKEKAVMPTTVIMK